MLRSIGVVLAGYILIGVLVVATDKVVGGFSPGQWQAGRPIPTIYFAVSIITAPVYSVLGGWVTAHLAKTKAWQHVFGLIIFGELMGVLSTVIMWGQQPLWYAVGLLVLYPISVALGGLLALPKRRVVSQ